MTGVGMGLFILVWAALLIVGIGGFIIGIVAIIDVAQTPAERFGPWWDNTKQLWLIGLAVAFVVPLGTIIAGIHWYRTGRAGFAANSVAGRPFWAGAPKPAPYVPGGPPQPYGGQPPPPPPPGPPRG